MAPTDRRTQPGALGGGQLQRPDTRAPSRLWDLRQVYLSSELQFPHLENGENVLYLTVLPRTEEFLGMQDFFFCAKTWRVPGQLGQVGHLQGCWTMKRENA